MKSRPLLSKRTKFLLIISSLLLFPITGSLNSDIRPSSYGSLNQWHPSVSTNFAIKQRNPVVNEHSKLLLKAIDSNGQSIKRVFWESGSPDIAAIDAQTGEVTGIQQGFATITAHRDGETASVFVVVARVKKGKGAQVPGDTKVDNNGSLYLSNPTQNIIMKADKALESDFEVFAGKPKQAGFVNGNAKDALFAGPTAIAVNNGSQGGLFVTDTLNHSIRKVGFNGLVETIVGKGSPGVNSFSNNSALPFSQVVLRSPRGIAVESGGNLYISDTDNNAIYYIDFTANKVSLVAGIPGQEGKNDGDGKQARFKRPAGLALSNDGQILTVADEDNNRVRIVQIISREAGNFVTQVSTIGAAGGSNLTHSQLAHLDNDAAQLLFNQPSSLSFDGAGNIYVVDNDGVQVVTRPFSNAPEIISLAQPDISFTRATSVMVRGNEAFVLDAEEQNPEEAVKVVTVGEPSISEVSPDTIALGQDVTIVIKGKNFAPESIVTIGNSLITDVQVISATEIHLMVPNDNLPGSRTLSVLTRGGIAQQEVSIISKKSSELSLGEVTTVAGGAAYFGDGGLAINSNLIQPTKATVDALGNLYVADRFAQRVRRVDVTSGQVTTVAGGGTSLQDGIVATLARIVPLSLDIDNEGNIFIGDALTTTVRRIDALNRTITTVAGIPESLADQPSGDGGPATKANLGNVPQDIAVDAKGNLYIAAGYSVRRVDANTGIITTVAGNGTRAFGGDGGLALLASIPYISGITLDANNNLYIVAEDRVRRVDAQTRIITTVAGNGNNNLKVSGPRDGSLATDVPILTNRDNSDVVLDQDGNMFIGENFLGGILRVDSKTKTVSTVKINPLPESGSTVCENLVISGSLAINGNSKLYVVEMIGRVRAVDLTTGSSVRVIGSTKLNLSLNNGGDGDFATKANLGKPLNIVSDRQNNIYISDLGNGFIRRIDGRSGIISTYAGRGTGMCDESGGGDGIPAIKASIKPKTMATDRAGNLYFADNSQIKRIDVNSGIINIVAGLKPRRGIEANRFSGDNGPATEALLGYITALAINDQGDIFVAATHYFSDGRIRKIDAKTGIITTIAGNGSAFSGDGGPAVKAGVNPLDIAIDSKGNILIVNSNLQYNGSHIRVINSSTGIIRTIAGTGNAMNYSGEGGPAINASLGFARTITVDPLGNIYVGAIVFNQTIKPTSVPRGSPRVWRIDGQSGIISVMLDSHKGVYNGDGQSSKDASLIGYEFDGQTDVEVDALGNLLVLNRDDGSIAALRFIKLTNTTDVNKAVNITGADYVKPTLLITGIGFGARIGSTQIFINDKNVSQFTAIQSDQTLILKGDRKTLNIKKSANVITIINEQGVADTFKISFD